MLRAVSAIYVESQTLEVLASARRDIYKFFRTFRYASSALGSVNQTVLTSDGSSKEAPHCAESADGGIPPPPPPPPRPPVRRAWALAAAAAVTASLGGVYFYRKLSDEEEAPATGSGVAPTVADEEAVVEPSSGSALPGHVQYLLVGGGTASFAAMRALRSLRPDALVLVVGAEPHPPYMRPPLSKELWREPDLSRAAPQDLPALSFRQWNGKRRALAYEPLAFYTPAEALAASGGGAALARGWRVARLDVQRREAELHAPGREPVHVTYDECLLATGSRARRLPALDEARAHGRVLALRDAADAVRLARALDAPALKHVLLIGGGFLASELSAALADRLKESGVRVTQLYREEAPLWHVLPPYLAREAARRLAAGGVALRPQSEVVAAAAEGEQLVVRLRGGEELRAGCVVECCGAEPALEAARASGLEEHEALGGVLVSAELQARAGVWAAGDVACFYDVALGRRRLEHHDHAVVSGRLAGENMAAVHPPKPYTHQSMFWSDLGPELGYEAIGIIDSRLPTVGVFSATATTAVAASANADGPQTAAALATADGPQTAAASANADGPQTAAALATADGPQTAAASATADGPQTAAGAGDSDGERRFERGVVFYTREKRVVGVLLWNLFNRMHVARQVLAQGEFEDLFEVAKLFALHEED